MRRIVLLLAASAFCLGVAPAPADGEVSSGQIAYDSGDSIHLINADGSGDRVFVTRAIDSAWSPDGSRLAFISVGPVFEIEIVYSDGFAEAFQLDRPLAIPQGPLSWSPDGKHFVFTASPDSTGTQSHLYVVDTDGRNVRQLTFGTEDREPSWSPDGSWIAFTRVAGNRSTIDLVHPDGTGLRPMLPDAPQVGAFAPAWSPDSQRIAFSESTSTGVGIFVADLFPGSLRQLTTGPYDFDPSWSPDGRFIAFGTGHANEIDVIGADGSRRKPVVVSSGIAITPSWRPYAPALRLLSHGVSPLVTRRAFTVIATATATGAAPVSSVSVKAVVQGKARILSLMPGGQSCAAGYRGMRRSTCSLGDLAPGAFVVVRLRVEPLQLGSLQISLSTSSRSNELDRTDNAVVLRTRVVRTL